GLAIVQDLLGTGAMSDYHFAHAARADLAHRAGSLDEARDSYRRAIELVQQEPERRYLERRLARIPG
ncbi:MAG: RNA polymerase subunit sigma-24, partial [Gemmatimonadaceae bacterium]